MRKDRLLVSVRTRTKPLAAEAVLCSLIVLRIGNIADPSCKLYYLSKSVKTKTCRWILESRE